MIPKNCCLFLLHFTLVFYFSYVPTLEPTWKRRGMLYRHRLEMCSCTRCKDPTEFGSYLSALICEKCNVKKSSAILPHDPLDQDSYWHCTTVHKSIKIEANLAQQLAIGE